MLRQPPHSAAREGQLVDIQQTEAHDHVHLRLPGSHLLNQHDDTHCYSRPSLLFILHSNTRISHLLLASHIQEL